MCLLTINDVLLLFYMVMRHSIWPVRLSRAFRFRSGQAMVEYVVITGTLLACLTILYLFLGTFKEFGSRVLNLIGSEYP